MIIAKYIKYLIIACLFPLSLSSYCMGFNESEKILIDNHQRSSYRAIKSLFDTGKTDEIGKYVQTYYLNNDILSSLIIEFLNKDEVSIARILGKSTGINYYVTTRILKETSYNGERVEILSFLLDRARAKDEEKERIIDAIWAYAEEKNDNKTKRSILDSGMMTAKMLSDKLNYAAQRGDIKGAKMLLEHGAKASIQSSSLLTEAIEKGDLELQMLLVMHGANLKKASDIESMLKALFSNNFLAVRRIMELNPNLNTRIASFIYGHCLLKGNDDTAAFMKQKFSINASEALKDLYDEEDEEEEKFLASINVTTKDKIRVAKILLKEGGKADPKTQGRIFALAQDAEDSRELVALGLNPASDNSAGLRANIIKGNLESVQYLISAGANIQDITEDDILLAAQAGKNDIVNYIKSERAMKKRHDRALARKQLLDAVDSNSAHKLDAYSSLSHDLDLKEALRHAIKNKKILKIQQLVDQDVDLEGIEFDALGEILPHLDHLTLARVLMHFDVTLQEYWDYVSHIKNDQDLLLALKSNPIKSQGKLRFIAKKAIETLLRSNEAKIVEEALEILLREEPDAFIIGLTNQHGQWSSPVLKTLISQIKDHKGNKAYLAILHDKLAKKEYLLKHFSGLINPGAGDTYPEDSDEWSFELADIGGGENGMAAHEITYQAIIDTSKKYAIPYIGICAGMQHLVLNHGGKLKARDNLSWETTLHEGSGAHYMALTDTEKQAARENCKLSPLEFDSDYAHYFMGDSLYLGEGVTHDATSNGNYVAAVSKDGYMFGFQFHPENEYHEKSEEVNRSKLIWDSFFGLCVEYNEALSNARSKGTAVESAREAFREKQRALTQRLRECVGK